MTEQVADGGTVRSRQVSAELRRLRRAARLTATEVGALLGMSQSKISRMETGKRGLKVDEVAALLGLYKVHALRRVEILNMVREADRPGWVWLHGQRLPDQWATLIELETNSCALWSYEPLWIPGMLQTADYARAVIAGVSEVSLSETELDVRVAARLGRQSLLSRPLPPEVHVLLYEPALRVPVGSPRILAAQLRHLVEMTLRPRVTLQIVPLAAGPHPGLEGPFMIMKFPADPPLIYLENRVQSTFLEEVPHIESYRLAWERIAARALPAKRSVELIARAAADLVRSAEGRHDQHRLR